MIYLTSHQTQAAYDAVKDSLPKPQVALVKENMTVNYKPYVPTPSHEYVEIGGVKWATMNVGATAITDTGLYFQWGDTQGYTASQIGSGSGKKLFDDSNNDYKYGNYEYNVEPDYGMTKYNSNDGKTVLDAEDDAVTAAWGGNWRMPTKNELTALFEAVNTAWTQVNGVSGLMCTSKTDGTKTLFFPACGAAWFGSLHETSNSYFWTNTRLSNYPYLAYRAIMDQDGVTVNGDDHRGYGYQVRGVLGE